MAGDWIKFRRSLIKDGRVRVASRKCHANTVTVLGGIVTLWCLGDEQADENGELYGYTTDDINSEIGIDGFCESLPSDWIDVSGDWVILPNYQQHNGTSAKNRAQAKDRQTAKRKREKVSRTERDGSVTREEKRRDKEKEKKNTNRFTPPTTDQVAKYVAGRDIKINPQQFVDHYETNGWMRGKTKIKDWKACVRTWEKNAATQTHNRPRRPLSND